MAKRSPIIDMVSYGIYSKWDSKSKLLPKIQEFTTRVPADIDVEFGYIINIKKAKGKKVYYCIDHPDVPNEKGQVMAPFEGEEHINNNDWDFYLGDTIWSPIEDKLGKWRMTITLDDRLIADKTFELVARNESQFWKERGF